MDLDFDNSAIFSSGLGSVFAKKHELAAFNASDGVERLCRRPQSLTDHASGPLPNVTSTCHHVAAVDVDLEIEEFAVVWEGLGLVGNDELRACGRTVR